MMEDSTTVGLDLSNFTSYENIMTVPDVKFLATSLTLYKIGKFYFLSIFR